MFFYYIKVVEKLNFTKNDIIKYVILFIDRTVILCRKKVKEEELEKVKTS